jgi:hypothetical protein
VKVPTEKELDQAIEAAFKDSPSFTRWFLSRTKFKDDDASYYWSRSNYPWGKAELNTVNAMTGARESVVREGETDILVVFETPNKRRVALHIENKLASGSFTLLQPEVYRARAAKWKSDPRYCNYDDWETVLVAPNIFFDRFRAEAAKFDRFVPHEDIAIHVPLFGAQPA